MNLRTAAIITGYIILATVVIWIAWDFYVYIKYGNPATESATLLTWAIRAPGVSFLVGVLCGHLFFPQMQAVKDYIKDALRK